MSRLQIMSGGLLCPLNRETTLRGPEIKPAGTVEQAPTGRVYTTDRPGGAVLLPGQASLTFTVRGISDLRCEEAWADYVALLLGATRLYVRDAYLRVLRVANVPAGEEGFGGLSRRGTVAYDLVSVLYMQPDGTETITPIRGTS